MPDAQCLRRYAVVIGIAPAWIHTQDEGVVNI